MLNSPVCIFWNNVILLIAAMPNSVFESGGLRLKDCWIESLASLISLFRGFMLEMTENLGGSLLCKMLRHEEKEYV